MRELNAEAEDLWRVLTAREDDGDERAVPLLVRLAESAPIGSDAWAYACRRLASSVIETDPWRASVLVRGVVRERRDDHAAWGILGLALSLLGHYRCAARAYREALSRDPLNPSYAHNLGHLYDVALDRPDRGVELLRRALAAAGDVVEVAVAAEIAASHAHALMRVGDLTKARAQMREVVKTRWARAEHHALYREILALTDAALDAHEPLAAPSQRRIAKRRTTCGERSAATGPEIRIRLPRS
jgi:tetratricopeptide (TPR) repeat protein